MEKSMTKDQFVAELKEFHHHHDNRLLVIEHIIKGITSNTNFVCVSLYDCTIYKWLEKRKDLLYKIYGSDSIKVLHARHKEWHDESEKICQLLIGKEKKNQGILGKVFGKKNVKMSEGEYDIAMAYLSNLKELTLTIDSTFVRMSKRANALQEEIFLEI